MASNISSIFHPTLEDKASMKNYLYALMDTRGYNLETNTFTSNKVGLVFIFKRICGLLDIACCMLEWKGKFMCQTFHFKPKPYSKDINALAAFIDFYGWRHCKYLAVPLKLKALLDIVEVPYKIYGSVIRVTRRKSLIKLWALVPFMYADIDGLDLISKYKYPLESIALKIRAGQKNAWEEVPVNQRSRVKYLLMDMALI